MKKIIILTCILFLSVPGRAQENRDTVISNYITKDVVEKLSNEELISLITNLEAMNQNQGIIFGDNETDYIARQFANPDFVKGIIISLIISMLLFIILLITLPLYFNFQKTKSFHRMINGFTEKGQEIPKELILSVSHKKSDFHKSIILISTGIAISFALIFLSPNSKIWAIGMIPLIIGIGYFIAYRVAK
ncbi:MAG: hypothetical protein JXB19_08725 [Bacteroidales bacterium]|nr:hypothetical protein [Bacteroidales bacterium]